MKLSKITEDKFTLAIVAGSVILAAFFVFGLWLGVWSEINSKKEGLQTEIKNLEKFLKNLKTVGTDKPTQQRIEEIDNYKKSLDKAKQDIIKFYKRSNTRLEEWCDEMKKRLPNPGATPDLGTFQAIYQDERDKLILVLTGDKEHSVDVPEDSSGGKTKEVLLGFETPSDPTKFKMLQKRFWIQKHLFEAMVKSEVKRCDLLDFKLSDVKPKPPTKIKSELGEIIGFRLIVRLTSREIAPLIESISATAENDFFVIINKVEINRLAEEFYQRRYYESLEPSPLPEEKERKTYRPPTIEPPLVKVEIIGGVLDFDEKELDRRINEKY